MNMSEYNYKKLALNTLVTTVMLVSLAGLASFFYRAEIQANSELIVNFLGPAGIILIALLSDMFVSFTPPDLFMFAIVNSSLKEHSNEMMIALAVASCLAGNLGWLLGRTVATKSWAPKFILTYAHKHHKEIEKYGAIAVVVGALTPVPYSATNWAAGLMGLSFKKYFLASLTRIPRIIITFYLYQNLT